MFSHEAGQFGLDSFQLNIIHVSVAIDEVGREFVRKEKKFQWNIINFWNKENNA